MKKVIFVTLFLVFSLFPLLNGKHSACHTENDKELCHTLSDYEQHPHNLTHHCSCAPVFNLSEKFSLVSIALAPSQKHFSNKDNQALYDIRSDFYHPPIG